MYGGLTRARCYSSCYDKMEPNTTVTMGGTFLLEHLLVAKLYRVIVRLYILAI